MSRMARFAAMLGFALVIGGCATYRAQPLDREAMLRQLHTLRLEDIVQDRAEGTTRPAIDLSDGLDESELVGVALTLNPELKARRLEIGEAESVLVSAGLWPNPELGLSVTQGIGGATGYSIGADLLFELLRSGERSAKKEAARAGVAVVKADIAAEELRLARDVRTQWLRVLSAEAIAGHHRMAVSLKQKVVNLLRERRAAGDATELEVSTADVELGQSQRALRDSGRQIADARRELNRLVGLPPDYRLNLSDAGKPLAIPQRPEIRAEELDQRMLAGRPELRAREAEYQKAEQDLRAAILGQYPRLSFGPVYERELEGDDSLGLGASLELPLFDRNQGEIAEKRTQRDRLRQGYLARLHELRAETATAWSEVVQASEELGAQQKELIPQVQRNDELFAEAFRAGELSVLDLIITQQRNLEVRRDYLETVLRYRKAIIALESAIGSSQAWR